MFIGTPCILNHLVNKAPHMLECPPLVCPRDYSGISESNDISVIHRTTKSGLQRHIREEFENNHAIKFQFHTNLPNYARMYVESIKLSSFRIDKRKCVKLKKGTLIQMNGNWQKLSMQFI